MQSALRLTCYYAKTAQLLANCAVNMKFVSTVLYIQMSLLS